MFIPFLTSAGSRDVKVYRGTSRYSSDILFTIDSPLTVEQFVAVWHTVTYIF